MTIPENIAALAKEIPPHVTLVAVSKTYTPEKIIEAYSAGLRLFGENKVQELVQKKEVLPGDIKWHLIGHLQTNKVKQAVAAASLIHSVDSMRLLREINKQAQKINRTQNCLLQIHIAKEETKFGLSFDEAEEILKSEETADMKNIRITGLMGMSTLTADETQIRKEFRSLKSFYNAASKLPANAQMTVLSMGMSSDYKIAIEEGSNMIRVGSSIFGTRA